MNGRLAEDMAATVGIHAKTAYAHRTNIYGKLKLGSDHELRLLAMKSALWTGRYDEAIAVLGDSDLPLTSTQRRTLTAAFEALKSHDAGLRARSVAELVRSL